MLFNSLEFAVFLPIVFALYWVLRRQKLVYQNILLIAASYVFYGWWDVRFLSLIVLSSLVDYLVGRGLGSTDDKSRRKWLLVLSLAVNLGLLGVFKYYNFFIESFAEAFTFFGQSIEPSRLNIVLPVGISFYTFQTLSYSIDVYRRRIEPTKNAVAFFAFVSFFPQLVAGPIERAPNLLPQFFSRRIFQNTQATDGVRQILWGMFKKVVIADNAAVYVNEIFGTYQDQDPVTLFLGGVFFAFQIYGDFSGYSDIAIGTARLFGFNLMKNFAFPYFSRDIAEFWRRWHISLSTWFRDYLYIPLGGSRGSNMMKIRNTFAIFVISGLWHGANWTFVIWGFLNALYFLPLLLGKRNRKYLDTVASGRIIPSVRELMHMGVTFFLTVIAWIFFRSENVGAAFTYCERMFSTSLLSRPDVPPIAYMVILVAFIVVEWFQREKEHGLDFSGVYIPLVPRWILYYSIILVIIFYGGAPQEFIYFQF